MSEQNERVELKFLSVPDGTHYKENHISQVPAGKAQQYINEGHAVAVDEEPLYRLEDVSEVEEETDGDEEE